MNTEHKRNPHLVRGFTFVEILVVIAVLATLAAILVLILNPAEYLRRARDAQRLSDYTRIGQAMNLYAYSTALGSKDQDFDGPPFPDYPPPKPLTDSCKTEANQRIFVSVPSDNGESDPAPPPTGWVYRRVAGTQLRAVDGSGWLPVDFTEAGAATAPLSVLPVDPVNTFNSGYYYSYACGSYEMNLRFESEKYQELASTDNGEDTKVYETGTKLDVLPEQPAYHPTSTATVVPGAFILDPNLITFNDGWSVIGGTDVAVVVGSDNSSYVQTTTESTDPLIGSIIFSLTDADSALNFNNINKISVKLIAKDTNFSKAYKITPFLKLGSDIHTGSEVTLGDSFPALPQVVEFTGLPFSTWNKTNVNTMEVGVIFSSRNGGTGAAVQVSEIQLKVDYQ